MNKKNVEVFDLVQHMQKYLTVSAYKDIISWCEQNIDFSQEVSAQRNKLDFDLYPYQVPILKEWQMEKDVIKTIVVVAPEQVGKTNMFVCGIMYNFIFSPCQSMVVYQSDQDAVDANQTKLLPLMRHIPVLKAQLDKPRSYRSDCYRFSNLVSFFQGAGAKIVSKSCKIVVGDEVDAWPTINGIDNVRDLKKRTRSYDSSICFLISTPTIKEGRIWQQFLKGSQGYWHLRCKGCGQLTMRSCDVKNLQFESDIIEGVTDRVVRKDSIRLICPKCGYEHKEEDKKWMNQHGQFIHLVPQRQKTSPSYQIGGLASQLPAMCWQNIANKQLEAGKRAALDAQMEFDNSIRGLPYKRRQIVKEDLEQIREHIYKNANQRLKPEQIEFVFGAVDSMLQYWRYGIFALDIHDNIHVIDIGEVRYLTFEEGQREHIDEVLKQEAYLTNTQFKPVQCLEDIINKKYYGFEPLLVGIDAHATSNYAQVQNFIQTHPKMIGYFGGRFQMRYAPSQTARCFNVSAKQYQVQAIFYLHSQKKRETNYMFIDENIDKKYWDQIIAVKPNYNSKNGHVPENWNNGNSADHAFDCIKMGLWVRDFCIQQLDKQRFNFAQSPRLRLRFEKSVNKEILKTQREIKQQQMLVQKQQQSSWFQGLFGNNYINGYRKEKI